MNRALAKLALGVMVFCCIAGIGGLVGGVMTFKDARTAKSDPQRITAARLAEHGPGNNHYVQITEVTPRTESVVVEGGDRKTYWHKAYIPLSSANDDPDSTKPPQIILVSESVTDQAGLDKLATEHSVTGMVGAWDVTLDDESRGLLHSSYPKMDTTKCLVISHDATPPSKSGGVACMVIGVILLLITLALGVTARRGRWGEHLAPKKLATFGVNPMFHPPRIQPPSIQKTPIQPPPIQPPPIQPQRSQPPPLKPQAPPRLEPLPDGQKGS